MAETLQSIVMIPKNDNLVLVKEIIVKALAICHNGFRSKVRWA
jgi:hypothetical protein